MITRRQFLKRSAIAAGAMAIPGMWAHPAPAAVPKKLIVDIDMGSDMDDAADLAMICALARRHIFEILGVLCCNKIGAGYATPASRSIVDYYKVPGVIYGKYSGSAVATPGTLNHFGQELTDRFRPGDSDANYTESVTQYQNILTNQADASVTIIATGFASVTAALLAAAPSLVAAKVAELIWVAGYLPGPTNEPYNVVQDEPDALYLTNNWPSAVPLTWAGIELGDLGLWNRPPQSDDAMVNPVKYAFDINALGQTDAGTNPAKTVTKPATYRWSWSAPAILHAAFPGTYTSYVATNGKVKITGASYPSTAATEWDGTIHNGQRYLQLTQSTTAINALLDELMNSAHGAFPSAIYIQNTVKAKIGMKVQ